MLETAFEGKSALVTGGGTGIGRAIASMFAEAGARVVISGRRIEPLKETAGLIRGRGGSANYVVGDVSRSDDVAAMVRAAAKASGHLDMACNCAATFDGREDMTIRGSEEDFDRVIATSLKGVWLSMQEEIQAMAQHGGCIVNISSINAIRPSDTMPVYSASKAAVESLTATAALKHAPRIRVNAVRAGFFDTSMLRDANGSEHVAEMSKFVPLGRIGDVAEAAAVVAWLCSDAASYVTGATIPADGGVTWA